MRWCDAGGTSECASAEPQARSAVLVSDSRRVGRQAPPGAWRFSLRPQSPGQRRDSVPLSSVLREAPTHVRLRAREGGLRRPSMAKCEQITTLRRDRLIPRPLGDTLAPGRMGREGSAARDRGAGRVKVEPRGVEPPTSRVRFHGRRCERPGLPPAARRSDHCHPLEWKVAESRGTGEQPQKSPRVDSLILRPSYSAHESCPAHHFDARVPGQAARPRGEAEAHIFLGARRGVGRARPGGASVCWCNRGRP